jgi:hypothetical protein
MADTDRLPRIVGVQISAKHAFSKTRKDAIRLIENFGVEGTRTPAPPISISTISGDLASARTCGKSI